MIEAPVVSGFGRRCLRSTRRNRHRSHTITLDVNIYFSGPKNDLRWYVFKLSGENVEMYLFLLASFKEGRDISFRKIA
jgi:hypothetical protein